MNEVTTFKIQIPENVSFEEVLDEREKGGKFIAFTYLIPRPIFAPISRISKIYFLRPGEKASIYSLKYNLITLLWGWCGLPQGPAYMASTIIQNKTGTDLSKDVYENLTKEGFESRYVKIKKIYEIYIAPDKSELKELTKCFTKYSQNNSAFIEKPIIGNYIDTEKPYYVIGLSGSDFEKRELLKVEIYKYFYAHNKFEFVNLAETNETTEKLKTQGVQINCC